jgi:hypothetical protein
MWVVAQRKLCDRRLEVPRDRRSCGRIVELYVCFIRTGGTLASFGLMVCAALRRCACEGAFAA